MTYLTLRSRDYAIENRVGRGRGTDGAVDAESDFIFIYIYQTINLFPASDSEPVFIMTFGFTGYIYNWLTVAHHEKNDALEKVIGYNFMIRKPLVSKTRCYTLE